MVDGAEYTYQPNTMRRHGSLFFYKYYISLAGILYAHSDTCFSYYECAYKLPDPLEIYICLMLCRRGPHLYKLYSPGAYHKKFITFNQSSALNYLFNANPNND